MRGAMSNRNITLSVSAHTNLLAGNEEGNGEVEIVAGSSEEDEAKEWRRRTSSLSVPRNEFANLMSHHVVFPTCRDMVS
uniref:Uncharacterized protein n=1 Tax=Zea mays TaxID=4577 RepID=A0A804U9U7_MAIZE